MKATRAEDCRVSCCVRWTSLLVLLLVSRPSWAADGEKGGAVLPDSDAGIPPVALPEDPEFDRALNLVKADFPDLRSVVVRRQEFLDRLWKIAETPGGEPDATRLAKCRLVAAAALEAIGREKDARSLWVKVATSDAPVSLRAKGFFDIGMHYFLRERYTDAWTKYWKHLPSIAPKSEWAARVERFAPFLRLVTERTVPRFEGSFGELGQVSSESLRGKCVILQFWSTTAQGSFVSGERLNAIKARLRNSPLRDRVLILGVNLDTDSEAYEKALVEWTFDFDRQDGRGSREVELFDWPQHHDGRGFESPLVRAFGIPRAPFEILLGPQGEPLYVRDQTPRKQPAPLRKTLFDSLQAAAAARPRAGGGKALGEQ